MDASSHPTLHDEALAAVVTVITLSGRFVPVAVEATAVQLLADLWTAGLRYGVQPADWRSSCSLPVAVLDVLVMAEARRRNSPTAD